MDELENLTLVFEGQRSRLLRIAYRLLGSKYDADDAVQETWIRMARSDMRDVENLDAWLTTVIVRISLNILRSTQVHPTVPLDEIVIDAPTDDVYSDPEHAALVTAALDEALTTIVGALRPAERLVLVLHDVLCVPFRDIAELMGVTTESGRQLASRARRRLRQDAPITGVDEQVVTTVTNAFCAALRCGNPELLMAALALLDVDSSSRTTHGLVRLAS